MAAHVLAVPTSLCGSGICDVPLRDGVVGAQGRNGRCGRPVLLNDLGEFFDKLLIRHVGVPDRCQHGPYRALRHAKAAAELSELFVSSFRSCLDQFSHLLGGEADRDAREANIPRRDVLKNDDWVSHRVLSGGMKLVRHTPT